MFSMDFFPGENESLEKTFLNRGVRILNAIAHWLQGKSV